MFQVMQKTHYYLVDTSVVLPGAAVSALKFNIIQEETFTVHNLKVSFENFCTSNATSCMTGRGTLSKNTYLLNYHLKNSWWFRYHRCQFGMDKVTAPLVFVSVMSAI